MKKIEVIKSPDYVHLYFDFDSIRCQFNIDSTIESDFKPNTDSSDVISIPSISLPELNEYNLTLPLDELI